MHRRVHRRRMAFPSRRRSDPSHCTPPHRRTRRRTSFRLDKAFRQIRRRFSAARMHLNSPCSSRSSPRSLHSSSRRRRSRTPKPWWNRRTQESPRTPQARIRSLGNTNHRRRCPNPRCTVARTRRRKLHPPRRVRRCRPGQEADQHSVSSLRRAHFDFRDKRACLRRMRWPQREPD